MKLIGSIEEGVIQDAIHSELFASHLYKHVANRLQRIGYFGAAEFFKHESADELEHYQKHADFLNDMGAVANIPTLANVSDKVDTLLDAVSLAYETESGLMRDYADWYGTCATDPVVQQHLLGYLEIQRKSVGEYGDLLARIKLAGNDACGLLLIDQELAK